METDAYEGQEQKRPKDSPFIVAPLIHETIMNVTSLAEKRASPGIKLRLTQRVQTAFCQCITINFSSPFLFRLHSSSRVHCFIPTSEAVHRFHSTNVRNGVLPISSCAGHIGLIFNGPRGPGNAHATCTWSSSLISEKFLSFGLYRSVFSLSDGHASANGNGQASTTNGPTIYALNCDRIMFMF